MKDFFAMCNGARAADLRNRAEPPDTPGEVDTFDGTRPAEEVRAAIVARAERDRARARPGRSAAGSAT